MSIVVHDINQQQKEMIDKMWSLDTRDDLERWIATLPRPQQQEARTLEEMLVWAVIDQQVDEMTHYNLAANMIEKIK